MNTTTTTHAEVTAAAPLCQSCRQPIRPDEPVHACPAPDGSTWHMHASVAQCLARLTNARLEVIAGHLVRS